MRDQIWDATLEPKLLRVGIGGAGARSPVARWSPRGNPVALRVCTESRARALRRYTLAVPVYGRRPPPPGAWRDKWSASCGLARRYIDPERDLVFFDPRIGSVSSSLPSATAGVADWIQTNRDFRQLMDGFLRETAWRPACSGGGDRANKNTGKRVQRIAFPRWWWQFRCRRGDMCVRPPTFFGEISEIYIVEDLSLSPAAEEAQAQAKKRAEDGGDTSLASLVPEYLTTCGWEIRREGRSVVVTEPGSCTDVRIQDLFDAPLDQLDLSIEEFTRGDSFVSQEPDALYYRKRDLHI